MPKLNWTTLKRDVTQRSHTAVLGSTDIEYTEICGNYRLPISSLSFADY